jgi:hypothetical protein
MDKNIRVGRMPGKPGREARLFRLQKGDHGTLGIGTAYYLDTKLAGETAWVPTGVVFAVNDDNHGSQSRSYKQKIWTTGGRTFDPADLDAMKLEVRSIAEEMYT